MEKIKIGNDVYEVPTRWSEVTLRQFRDVCLIKSSESEMRDDPYLLISVVSALSGIPEEKLERISLPNLNRLQSIMSFADIEKTKAVIEFEIDGQKYRMFEKIEKITARELIDLQSLFNDEERAIEKMHVGLAILYRPVVKRQSVFSKLATFEPERYLYSEDVERRAELFLDRMPASVAISAIPFSTALVALFLADTRPYSQQVAKKTMAQMTRAYKSLRKKGLSEKNGDGTAL